MKKAAESAKRALVIGGGFIGMLAAEALRKRAMDLTIVEMADQLMPQLLDAEGGKIFERAVRDAGVDLRLGTQVSAVGANGQGVRVTLSAGGSIDTDLLVVAAGVRPNLGCVANGVVEKGRGIRVNDHMETSEPGVYAAGDVAESADFVSGVPTVHAIWPTAVDQGRIAGANMAGRPVSYPGSLGMNVVGLFGVTLAQVGRFREAAGDATEVSGSGGGQHYRKMVIDPAGTMVGAMYLGDENGVAEMGVIHHAIKRREPWRQFVAYGERRGASYAAMLARPPRPLPPGTR
jgi:nitrite reductase (NADH) large subunit